jgi:15-cis-phytoene synthase
MTERKPRVPVSRQIARRSKSNLALALSTLPRRRKQDMLTFYAFCRVIDDIADEPVDTVEERSRALDAWRDGLRHGFSKPDELQAELEGVIKRYAIPRQLLVEIVDGVACDLTQTRYESYDDLLAYCYKVACVVGLVSIEIFGYKNPACRDYSIALGYALQITNIIRDVGEDARNGRIYLPQEDLRRFGVTVEQLTRGVHTPEFESLMEFQYGRAQSFYNDAERLLPDEDRHTMLAAEMMAQVYGEILDKIRRRHFQVFGPRIGLGKLRKITILSAYTARGILGAV